MVMGNGDRTGLCQETKYLNRPSLLIAVIKILGDNGLFATTIDVVRARAKALPG